MSKIIPTSTALKIVHAFIDGSYKDESGDPHPYISLNLDDSELDHGIKAHEYIQGHHLLSLGKDKPLSIYDEFAANNLNTKLDALSQKGITDIATAQSFLKTKAVAAKSSLTKRVKINTSLPIFSTNSATLLAAKKTVNDIFENFKKTNTTSIPTSQIKSILDKAKGEAHLQAFDHYLRKEYGPIQEHDMHPDNRLLLVHGIHLLGKAGGQQTLSYAPMHPYKRYDALLSIIKGLAENSTYGALSATVDDLAHNAYIASTNKKSLRLIDVHPMAIAMAEPELRRLGISKIEHRKSED